MSAVRTPFSPAHAVRGFTLLFATGLLGLSASAALAATTTAPIPVPAPKDTPYPGTIKITVDASDTSQGIFRVHESIPVKAGKLTLLYPKWIPGAHNPSGPISKVAGLRITADGKPLQWERNSYDVYSFHVDVPRGVSDIDVDFQYLSGRTGRDGSIQMTDKMLAFAWNQTSLYPAGHYSRQITVEPTLTLPEGWKFGTALEPQSQSGDSTTFKPVTYNTLVDSPVYAGKYFKRVPLGPDADAPVYMDIVADAPKYLEITPHQNLLHQELVRQELKLFGSHHYNHYDFLFSLSDHLSGNGMEHHRSTEVGASADYFTNWDGNMTGRDLLAHEFTHSWNGKFRRPADLWTPNFNVPMGDSLLWVYEGMTQYWGYVITARAGMWTPEQFLGALAIVAANYDRNRPGFQWRTIEDTTNDPVAASRAGLPYRSWQMSEEYYSAGQMLWLTVDSKIRALTNNQKSLDDFCKAFYGIDNGSYVTHTYTFEDLVTTLNSVAPFDWATFLHSRVDAHKPPLDGLAASGWKLVYTDEPSAFESAYNKSAQSARHLYNLTWSIGLTANKDNKVNDVRWNGPAFKAGVTTGATLVAVNGHAYSTEVMDDAMRAAKTDKAPIELLVEYEGEYKTIPVDYHDGIQHPHLVRVEGTPDYLSDIIAPK